MEQPDPTYVMLDMLLRVMLSEAIKACIWCSVASLFYFFLKRK